MFFITSTFFLTQGLFAGESCLQQSAEIQLNKLSAIEKTLEGKINLSSDELESIFKITRGYEAIKVIKNECKHMSDELIAKIVTFAVDATYDLSQGGYADHRVQGELFYTTIRYLSNLELKDLENLGPNKVDSYVSIYNNLGSSPEEIQSALSH
ncbi:MAG: hypothetical protein KBD63_07285 [Bacteriovoracaceae bacterium]|nr:hypothetical protein [Bacteriovoracaceae bacterium]